MSYREANIDNNSHHHYRIISPGGVLIHGRVQITDDIADEHRLRVAEQDQAKAREDGRQEVRQRSRNQDLWQRQFGNGLSYSLVRIFLLVA